MCIYPTTKPARSASKLKLCSIALILSKLALCGFGLTDWKQTFNIPHLLGYALQVLERDLAGLVVVEEPEGLEDLILPGSERRNSSSGSCGMKQYFQTKYTTKLQNPPI